MRVVALGLLVLAALPGELRSDRRRGLLSAAAAGAVTAAFSSRRRRGPVRSISGRWISIQRQRATLPSPSTDWWAFLVFEKDIVRFSFY